MVNISNNNIQPTPLALMLRTLESQGITWKAKSRLFLISQIIHQMPNTNEKWPCTHIVFVVGTNSMPGKVRSLHSWSLVVLFIPFGEGVGGRAFQVNYQVPQSTKIRPEVLKLPLWQLHLYFPSSSPPSAFCPLHMYTIQRSLVQQSKTTTDLNSSFLLQLCKKDLSRNPYTICKIHLNSDTKKIKVIKRKIIAHE